MPANKPRLNTLTLRRQLLLIESEVNRLQLGRDWQEFRSAGRSGVASARSVISIARSVASIFRRPCGARRASSNGEHKRSAWLGPLLDGARLGASLWSAFRSPEH